MDSNSFILVVLLVYSAVGIPATYWLTRRSVRAVAERDAEIALLRGLVAEYQQTLKDSGVQALMALQDFRATQAKESVLSEILNRKK